MSSNRSNHQLTIPLLLLSSLLLFATSIFAKSKSSSSISDVEVRLKKNDCYANIESGWHCKSSAIAKENCALKCLSPACFELVYESEPLEEGERDFIRGQEYRYFLQKQTKPYRLMGNDQLLWRQDRPRVGLTVLALFFSKCMSCYMVVVGIFSNMVL